jgi:uroporphyrinogen-III synthase
VSSVGEGCGGGGSADWRLAGRRVLVTRAPHQASSLADLLRQRGAEPILIPTIALAPPASYASLDAALACLNTYDWMVFTSANAVEAFHRRAQFLRLTHLPRKIAAIGAATERAAHAVGLAVDLVPAQAVAESLAEELAKEAEGKTFLLIRAAEARDVVPDTLRERGGFVTIADAYRNEIPKGSVSALQELFSAPERYPDAITFTSASTAHNLATLLEEAGIKIPNGVVKASIGPVTSEAMRQAGLTPEVQAKEASVASLVEALGEHFSPYGSDTVPV